MLSRNSRSLIARFTTPPKTAERRGALSQFQYHLLSSPTRCRSVRIRIHIFSGKVCNCQRWGAICHDEVRVTPTFSDTQFNMVFQTYYTKEDSATRPLLLSETSRCQFAHRSKDFKHEAHSDHSCVAFDTSNVDGSHTLSSSRLFSCTDFPNQDRKVEDLGIGKNAKGVIAFVIASKYAVVALKDFSPYKDGEMLLDVNSHCRYDHVGKGAVPPGFLGQTQGKCVYDLTLGEG
jgi:hypothetical protein